ncbi:RabGAP/TBC [Pleurotus eryngii]|uniref:RabGAP/TBC n=1 Tax=Pleurotus eryngii TaxID=5323 RepID=A0A9P6DJC0_PLEER|nr:RabGAP/TBC [Pleurotus eryngii]
MTIGGLLRTSSPAMSFSSGQRSPSVADVKTPKVFDSESSSMEGHRQRELRWIALMSSVPASQARKNKKVKKLLIEGVPSSVRYLVWIHLTDGKARNVPKVYEQLVKRGHVPSYKDIERDVQAYIRENSQPATMRDSMMSLLQAYLTMVPDVQYSRGLTLIAGNILLLAPEEDGFWTFVSLMDSYLRPYFSSSSSQMEVDAMLFSRALEANDPQVAKKVLTTMSINPTTICFPWFTSLFVNVIPSSYVQRVWDIFLFEGIPFLVRAGLALISTCRRQIVEATSPEAVLQLLQHPPSSLLLSSPDAFLSLLNSFKLKDDDFRKQRIKMEAQVKRQTQAPRAPPTSSISLPK